jgi:hypothetical protein
MQGATCSCFAGCFAQSKWKNERKNESASQMSTHAVKGARKIPIKLVEERLNQGEGDKHSQCVGKGNEYI